MEKQRALFKILSWLQTKSLQHAQIPRNGSAESDVDDWDLAQHSGCEMSEIIAKANASKQINVQKVSGQE